MAMITALSAILLAVGFGLAGPASAADVLNCNGIGNGGGQGIVCTVEVRNVLDNTNPAAPTTSSTITTTRCVGAADAAAAGLCETSGPIVSTELITHVDQCNYAVDGGGATLECTVNVINTIIGTAPVTAVPVTINQCNGTLDTGDVRTCNPDPSTTDPSTATIVQCNDSVNGGGSVVDCAVVEGSTVSDALVVTVNQCNNSANGGGSRILCRVGMTTTILAVTPPVVVPPVVVPPVVVPPVVPPVVVPPVVVPPVVVPPVVVTPVVVPPVVPPGTDGTDSIDSLASTGADTESLVGVSIVLLLWGTAAMIFAPRVSGRSRR
ncbi:MAG: hypothetical protein ACOH19_12030 [Rhodoglobus sp.]